MRRVLPALLLLSTALLGWVAPAYGHAVLEGSAPARGAELKSPPEEVTFTFNEPVEASLGAVRVFDTEGSEVQLDSLGRPGNDANSVGATLPGDLADGLYTATYHVVSADAHPISGGITFTIGTPGRGEGPFVQGKTISELLEQTETGKVTEVAFWFDRWIGYLAIAIAVGALLWMLFLIGGGRELPADGSRELDRRFRRLMIVAGAAGLLASLAAIPLQGAVGAGTTFWGAFGSGIPGEVIDTRFGEMMALRAGAWVVLLALVLFAGGRFRGLGPVPAAALAGALVLVVTPALAGHASTRDPGWLLIPSDIVHVAAMAAWTGGLGAMLWLLPGATRGISDPSERTALLTATTSRFSAMALVAVGLVGVSGAIQAIIDVGSIGHLLDTQFGRAVLIKIVLFALLIILGAVNRMRVIPALVRRLDASSSPGPAGLSLRRNLRAEVLLVIVVLGVTAALVSYPPPDAVQEGPVAGAVEVGENRVEYTVDPARLGSNEVHIYVFDDRTGAPVPVRSMDIAFSLPDQEIAPIESEARRAGPGHFVVPSAMLAVKGEWLAEAAIRLSRFEEPLASFEVEIE